MEVLGTILYDRLTEIGAGEGRNSKVFLANERQLGGEVVVKEIPRSNFSDPDAYFEEAQMMFAAHAANVVPIRYACKTDESICLVMPQMAGGSLAGRLRAGPLPPALAIRVFLDALTGLAQIHTQGLLHLDLKPSNILFDRCGRALVSDFGQSRWTMADGTADTPAIYGYCLTPEIAAHQTGVRESDIYQAGVALYRTVNGDAFFKKQAPGSGFVLEAQVASGSFPNRQEFRPHVPKRLRTIIRKAMKVVPTDRHRSATDLAQDLGQVSIRHDWVMLEDGGGNETWTSTRAGHPTLEVRSIADTGRHIIELHGTGKTRRAYRRELWRNGLTAKQAANHLKALFEALEA